MEGKEYYKIINIKEEPDCMLCGKFLSICLDLIPEEYRKQLSKRKLVNKGLVFDMDLLDIKVDSMIFVCKMDDEEFLEKVNSDDSNTFKIETEHSILVYNEIEECT